MKYYEFLYFDWRPDLKPGDKLLLGEKDNNWQTLELKEGEIAIIEEIEYDPYRWHKTSVVFYIKEK